VGAAEKPLWLNTCAQGTLRLSGALCSKQGRYVAEPLDFNAYSAPGVDFALAGPLDKATLAGLPVRGDIAHIRLAGRVFVPHYVVPVPRRLACDAPLLAAPGGDALATLAAGTVFHLLDMSAGYGWGEQPGGLTGYIALDALES
jgi:hypothetical protein